MKRLLLLITICISSVSFGQVPSYVPTNGLVGWWGFNGNANDESGNGNNGTVNGATLTTDRFGNPNSAYDFDGVDDYISCTNNFSQTFIGLSISCWVKVSTYPASNYGKIVDFEEPSIGRPTIQTHFQNGFSYTAASGVGQVNNFGNESQWVFLVGIWEGNNIYLYTNGDLTSFNFVNPSLNELIVSSLSDLRFGARFNNVDYFHGSIDDIGIWNRALTQCEISALYNAQTLSNPIVDLGGDTLSVCGTSTILDATDNSISSYNWSTGESTSSITVNSSGLYTVEVTDTNGCIGYDTTLVSIIDPTISASDTVICIGDSVTLSVTNSTQALTCSPLPSNLQNGLVAYYPFCGNANDESGNGNDGTVNGATLTNDRFGNSNSAYSFDGNDWIETPSGNVVDYSCSFWFKRDQLPVTFEGFIWKRSTLSHQYCETSLGNQFYTRAQYQSGNPIDVVTNYDIPLNDWIHCVFQFNESLKIIELYINGVLYSSASTSGGGYDASAALDKFYLGGRPFINNYYLRGQMDDFILWDRFLTPSEIQELYELGSYDITWSTGDTTSSITVQPTSTTTYSVTVSDGISSCVDDVTITVNDPQVNLGPDQNVCQGDSVLLDAGAGYDYYAWNTGDTTQTIYASQGGSYDATVGYETPVSNNYSLEFDGVDDYVQGSASGSSLDVSGSNTITMNAWIKPSVNSDGGTIFSYWPNGLNGSVITNCSYPNVPVHQYMLKLGSNNTIYFLASACNVNVNQFEQGEANVTVETLSPSEWHHVAMTYDTQTIKLYIDGSLSYTHAVLGAFDQYNEGEYYIGSNNGSDRIEGHLDDINIWNTALTQNEIQQYMNCPPIGNEAGLVGYWNFEEGSGTTATDLTSNGNNGTLVNGPIWSTDVPNQVCISCTASDTVVITELLPTTSSITEVNCDTYTAPDGQTYTSTGNYTSVIPNAVGCDSTITIDLTITNSNTGSETVTECDSYTWSANGQTYTQSGQYTEVLTNQNGCDSTVTLNLTITNSNTGSETVTECDSYTWNTNGQTYTQSGQYTEVLTNTAGCDSTVTLDLTITNVNNNISQLDDITLQSDVTNAQYQWVDCDEDFQPIIGETGQVFVANANGNYAVIVSENNCSDTSACITISKVGLDNISKDIFNVYPNPTSNSFTISSEKVINSEFKIIDSQGREVLKGSMNGQEHTIDISKLSKGVYSVVFNNTEYPVVSVIKE